MPFNFQHSCLIRNITPKKHNYAPIEHNGQNKNDKRKNNDLQNITYKTKDRIKQTPLKTGMNAGAPEG
jgi:hypothetical protein